LFHNDNKIKPGEKPFTFKIGGEAGYGIMSVGLLFSKFATRAGHHIFDYIEYPSIVRGGHNVMQATVANIPVRAPLKTTDFLVALNQETIDLHMDELSKGSGVVYDEEKKVDIKKIKQDIHAFPVPFNRLAVEVGGMEVMRNTVVLGAIVALLGGELNELKKLIAEQFAGKSETVVEKNKDCCEAGYNYALENYKEHVLEIIDEEEKKSPKVVITANESVALGAMAAGLQFAAIYPMTPTSNILHTLAPYQESLGFVYKQPEDEISAIHMALGAAFAGARSMVATSGGGFCLMTEGYGLAGITETPLVIIEGMRGGPATGLPTWTAQGDLRFVLHAHQGDFPRIVLAPGDAQEAFHLTMAAFNLAEKYQTPVVVLLDKHICESHQSFPFFDYKDFKIDRGKLILEKQADYKRYALSEDGISPRSIPGLGNHMIANSDEHNEVGYSNEEAENRQQQMDKRMRKLETCAENDMPEPTVYGPEKADITLVSWGSNKGAILDAIANLDNVNFLHINWINPFPAQTIKRVLENAQQIVNLECNYSAQLAGLIKEQTGITIENNFLKYDGRPFYPEEIVEYINNLKS